MKKSMAFGVLRITKRFNKKPLGLGKVHGQWEWGRRCTVDIVIAIERRSYELPLYLQHLAMVVVSR
jgi:hypothetical protein